MLKLISYDTSVAAGESVVVVVTFFFPRGGVVARDLVISAANSKSCLNFYRSLSLLINRGLKVLVA